MVFGIGCAAMAVSLVLVLAGVPAHLFYDMNGPGEKNRVSSHDPMKMTRSIDRNMKYIEHQMGHDKGQYNGHLDAVNTAEDAIPGMATAVDEMTASVDSIDQQLTGVANTTDQMARDMTAMAATSRHSAQTMGSLRTSVGTLSTSMGSLYTETLELTKRMGAIQLKAAAIARTRTSLALRNTRELNGVLPDGVPTPTTSLDAATIGIGGGIEGDAAATPDAAVAGAGAADAPATPAAGAQPGPAAAPLPGGVQ
jgi:hypothetical protein